MGVNRQSRGSTRRVRAAIRRERAIELRIAGKNYKQIAAQIAKDEGSDKPISTPAISKLIKKGLEEIAIRTKEEAEHYRDLETERLDELLEALWLRAKQGEKDAVDQVLKIMKRRADLWGLDDARKLHLSGGVEIHNVSLDTQTIAVFEPSDE